MAIKVKKRENESPGGLLFRFTKKVRESGVLLETRKRRFRGRAQNKRKRLLSALHRAAKKKEMARLKKLGLL